MWITFPCFLWIFGVNGYDPPSFAYGITGYYDGFMYILGGYASFDPFVTLSLHVQYNTTFRFAIFII